MFRRRACGGGNFIELLNPLLSGNSCPIVLYAPNTNSGTYTCTSGVIPSGKGPAGTLQQYGTSQYSYAGYTLRTSLALGTLQGGGYSNTDKMASASISTFVYTQFVQQYMAGYVQDDWKATHKLTLNLGLRYEYFNAEEGAGEPAGQFCHAEQHHDFERRSGNSRVGDAAEPNEPGASAKFPGPAQRG